MGKRHPAEGIYLKPFQEASPDYKQLLKVCEGFRKLFLDKMFTSVCLKGRPSFEMQGV